MPYPPLRPFALSSATLKILSRPFVLSMLVALAMANTLQGAEHPSIASELLIIDRQEALEDRGGVRLTLRNASERTITAWSILYEAGTSEGSTERSSTARDNYYLLPFPEAWEGLPLAPGQSTTIDIELDGMDFSPGRFAVGNYAVFSARVSAVFFDDGQALGDETDLIQRFIDRRVAEVTADILVRERLAELKATSGFSDSFLEGLRNLIDERKRLSPNQTPVARGAQDLRLHREQSALNSSIMHAENILRMTDKIGSLEAYAMTMERLDIDIANGLRNLPEAERRALQ